LTLAVDANLVAFDAMNLPLAKVSLGSRSDHWHGNSPALPTERSGGLGTG
jgi:hypothetical protein